MQSLRTLRTRPTAILTAARFGTTNSRGRAIVRDPRKVKQKTRASTALEQVSEREKAPVSPPQQPFTRQDPPPSFGSSMTQAFTWGVGMALAFTAVGVFFR